MEAFFKEKLQQQLNKTKKRIFQLFRNDGKLQRAGDRAHHCNSRNIQGNGIKFIIVMTKAVTSARNTEQIFLFDSDCNDSEKCNEVCSLL